ncbi:zinc-binding protein A33-like [Hemicordylus capensis]|uniref:zinc-binding protein A33-like n=1 Tax=Hemicordylus capensis TaxID=884348 RepID=UPI002304034B|nr:zinc-binding protein A33-like [Hemicordylus capensis]XP_053155782.1 zinc-binding protein A33-like [Hemicordylus capensis]
MAHKSQEQSLREELTCAICYDLFRDPVMLECMHHFCKECIQGYWGRSSQVATCPQCRQEFPNRSFRPHYLVSGVVETVRRCTSESEEHRKQMQKHLKKALQSYQMEHEKLLKMKHVTKKNICSLSKTSGELNLKIRAEFEYLHRLLVKEERTALMELAREEKQWLVKLQGASAQVEEGISGLKKSMRYIQQKLDKLENSLLEVENVIVRPPVQVEALPAFSIEQYKDRFDGPLQYMFWRRILKSIHPAPAPLTLDPDSAHPHLMISRDLTSVTERETPQPVPRKPTRFLQCVNVLSKESFESGRHYWEVWVGNKTKWDLGVAADSVDRAAKVRLCPENGYWAVRLRESAEYWAAATPAVRLKPQHLLEKVGVLLDCQKSKVTFYNAKDMSHLFTFHQAVACKFYPFFSTCFSDGKKNAEPMKICHLNL